MIYTTYRCEDCPFYYIDMEQGDMCSNTGIPGDRKQGELIPIDCPLLEEEITVKLI